jgi:hypothetical protein
MANKTSSFLDNSPPKVDQIWLNMVTGEVANAVPMAGDAVDGTGLVNDQLSKSIKSYVSQAGILCTDTSSGANVYIVNASTPFTNPVLKTGTRVRFKTANANTGSSTIAAFGGSGIACKKSDGSTDLATGDILANTEVEFIYNGTNWVQGMIGNSNLTFLANLPSAKATTTNQGVSYLNNPITIANNATDANNDIDFSAGNFQFNDGSGQALATAITKRLDATWSAGSGNGGLFSGTKAINTWYYLFAIVNATTGAVDAGFDISPSGANVPSGWKVSNVIQAIRTGADNNIIAATYAIDGSCYYPNFLLEETQNNTTGSGNFTLAYVPPIAIDALVFVEVINTVLNAYGFYYVGRNANTKHIATNQLAAGNARAEGSIYTTNAVVNRSFGGDGNRNISLYTRGFKLQTLK